MRLASPLLARGTELTSLHERIRQSFAARTPRLITVSGMAGVGKSRLVREVILGLGREVRVHEGRCLAYGEGITWWPLREVVHSAARIRETDRAERARAKLTRLVAETDVDPSVGPLVAGAIGLLETAVLPDHVWALRSLLEAMGRRRPTLVVVEDLHWGEPALLACLEEIASRSADTHLVILGTARQELWVAHPGWAGGAHRADGLVLEALPDDASRQLVDAQPGGSAIPAGLAERIAEAAEGNPLFLEEMVGMLRERGELAPDGAGGWRLAAESRSIDVPTSISVLLAARFDALPEADGDTARRASVIGRSFEAEALLALSPAVAQASLPAALLDLVRRELLRPDRPMLTLGEAYRFRHILLRDAAYRALPKAERAELHERFADWLAQAAGDRVEEYEAILGFHLEQAHEYHAELGGGTLRSRSLAGRAGERLLRAGRRAAWSGDTAAALALLGRAYRVGAGAALRSEIGHELAMLHLFAGDASRARAIADELLSLSRNDRDPRRGSLARVLSATVEDNTGRGTADPHRARRVAAAAVKVFDQADDLRGLAWARFLQANLAIGRYRVGEASVALQAAVSAATSLGDLAFVDRLRMIDLSNLPWGPERVDVGIARIDAILPTFEHRPILRGVALGSRATLLAMRGDVAEARSLWEEADRTLRATAESFWIALLGMYRAVIEEVGGDHASAAASLRYALAHGGDERDVATRVIERAYLAHALAALGQWQEVASLARSARELASAAGPTWEADALATSALVSLHEGRPGEARRLCEDAWRRVRRTDALINQGRLLRTLGRAAGADGDPAAARRALTRAARRYERKGATALAELARSMRPDSR